MKKRVSRAKFENIAYLSSNIVNMAIYIMVFVASVLKAKEGSLAEIIQAIYCTSISFLLVLHEFSTPAWALTYFGFLSIHRGKSLLLLFLGCLVMCKIPFNIIVAILAFTVGFAYFILSLVPNLPPPNGFLVHWQNHKDFWAEGLDLNIPTPMTQPIVSVPHPSAWHPSNPYTSPVNNTDYSKFQHNLVPQKEQQKNRKFVIY